MVHSAARPVLVAARRQLRRAAARWPVARKVLERAASELRAALDDDVYGAHYFGQDRDSRDRAFLSGYERYDRDTSNADKAAFLIWSAFPEGRHLDVGCATGFVVEALREAGFDASGIDVSQYAVDNAAPGARGHIRQASLLHRLPFADGSFDSISALETLEHLPPGDIPTVLRELRRVCRGHLLATIPSFGANPHGPGGWFQVKVRDDRVAHYESLGPDFEGPIPFEDLYRDKLGAPIEGHLTIASFSWWTKRFAEAGFVRLGDVEERLHDDVARFGLSDYWNLYVFRTDGASGPEPAVRDEAARIALARRWDLPGLSQ